MNPSDLIFLAGHRGLIGSAVERRLKVGGFRNILTRGREQLDLTDAVAVGEFFQKHHPLIVLLAAGRVGGIVQNKNFPADMISTNLSIQLNVMTAAQDVGVERFVFFGSSCMYPRVCSQPMKEEQLWSGVPEPTSIAYAAAKFAGLEMCLALNRQYGKTRFIPVIPNNAYGPGDDFNPQSSHVLSALLRRFHEARELNLSSVRLWGTGTPRREFVHADDIADACFHLLHCPEESLTLPINIGSGFDVSIRELAETIARVVGYGGRIEWDTSKPDGAPRKLLDSSRLSATGWRSKISLEEGLRATYDWYLKSQAEVPLP